MARHTLITILLAININGYVLAMHWYSNRNISILFALFDNQFVRQFQTALVNDLNENCTERIEFSINSTKECVRHELSRLRTKEKKILDDHYGQEIPRKEMCKDETIQKCLEKFAIMIKPCLPKHARLKLEKIGQIVNASIESLLCTNDGEKVTIIFDKWSNCTQTNVNCEHLVNLSDVKHLSDFFTDQRCSTYVKFIECKVGTFVECAELAHIYDVMLNNMYQVSPCY